ncbi:hypothetical protein REJC140_00114 [Pseudorhizobium endolithicum]|uniref:Uncharacterized protein n=1 Tax=Pseudorhizobium endolithicum TaxID=1191678 RepID=A0ABM8PCK2_9HYPH|nr:hypothetical protein [Pseudorhizobium endolithicum]CAD7023163.1 hypothetical protein REJC140_00114 [Pseudorhizobium endolithicum]
MAKIKVKVIKPFERYRIGDTPELSSVKASTLEKMGLVEPATKTAEKQIAKASVPTA